MSENGSSLLGAVEEIATQTERAGGIVRRLRQLTFREPHRPQWIQISEIIQCAMELIRPKLEYENITASLAVADNLPALFIDPVQLEEVFLNLFCNAAEAMTSEAYSGRELAVDVMLKPTREFEVKVSDTGPGLAGARFEQIFEPFFSTKPGRLGLGLTISRNIVKNHGGRLWVAPRANRGATFHFTLPMTDNQNEQ